MWRTWAKLGTQMENEHSIVVGAGPVGSLLAIYLAKRGVKVDIFERRPDMRTTAIPAGRSINLAMSDRGLRGLAGVGIEQEILDISIPMHGRMVHHLDGRTEFQPYGIEGQCIYSVSRAEINRKLMTLAERHGATIHFNQRCEGVDIESPSITVRNEQSGLSQTHATQCIYGTDGAFSAVRGRMMFTDRFDYSQTYLDHGYKELHIPPDKNGGFRMEKNALHIWPRGTYMLIALPNLDGSFTCTLFFPFEGERSFSTLTSPDMVRAFFSEVFPDAVPMMPTLEHDFIHNPTSSLCIVRCKPWNHGNKVLLVGDAAHAIVPFYGQGMNAGFEDCTVFDQLADSMWNTREAMFAEFGRLRKPNGDAIADLALRNFIEMRDLVADPRFILRKKIEKAINGAAPERWVPLYSMVTFSHIPYADALREGQRQDAIMHEVLSWPNIDQNWQTPEVFGRILSLAGIAA